MITKRKIRGRIKELQSGIEYLRGIEPCNMVKKDRMNYYLTLSRIWELQDLIGEEGKW